MALTQADLTALRRKLLCWYDRHRRDLPWRTDPPDAYAVLVSEAMLQQTQVATVLPYYARFMQRFPTLAGLAAADVQEVLPYWAGLGYYRRCHHLHETARCIVREHEGTIPADAVMLRCLPGIGPYTAGAIASIAYGRAVPAIDGNARRVLGRVLGTAPVTSTTPVPAEIHHLAQRWVSRRRPGDFNQALMELGATMCVPRRPTCGSCPLRSRCAVTQRQGQTEAVRPRSVRADARPTLELVTVAVQWGACLLYRQRPDKGLWGGLWEWPQAPLGEREAPADVARRVLAELQLEGRWALEPLHRLRHELTHRRVVFHAFQGRLGSRGERESRPPVGDGFRWLPLEGAEGVAISRAQEKLLDVLTKGRRQA